MANNIDSRVCVIGAGIAGLVTAKVLHEDGFSVVVFEKNMELGGVWAESRTYPGLRANNPRDTYAFSDHPYSQSVDEFPTAEQVRTYLESYADRFRIRPLMRLGVEVLNVDYDTATDREKRRFNVIVQSATRSSLPETQSFDFVVVCNGLFSEPFTPNIESADLFRGRIVHSSRLREEFIAENTRVVIIGAGKSALDCASWAAQHAQSTALIHRKPQWMVPRYFFNFARIDYVLMTRVSEAFLRYHRPSRMEAILHKFGRPLVRLWWNALSRIAIRQAGIPSEFVPERPLPDGFENIGIGSEFYALLRERIITTKRGQAARFTPCGIELRDGSQIDADVVVLATGWQQSISFLAPALHRLVERDGRQQLYRDILPPNELRLGFVGYTPSLACQLTSEVSAHWLSQCFRGELRLPSIAAMEDEIARVQKLMPTVQAGKPQSYYGAYFAHYIDDLIQDMGISPVRSKNCLTEHFWPIWPNRYEALGDERRKLRNETGTKWNAV
jgi:cation diffusion facilitator CzcD-associated flavoprotein CzcO